MRFGREQHEGQEGRRHHRGGFAQMVDEVGAEGERQPPHVRADQVGPEPPQIETGQNPGRPQGEEHEELEGHEGRKGRQRGHERIEDAGAIAREEGRSREQGGVPGGQLAPPPVAEGLGPQGEMEVGPVSRAEQALLPPGGSVSGRGEDEEQGEDEGLPDAT